jgi:hypothetical protein
MITKTLNFLVKVSISETRIAHVFHSFYVLFDKILNKFYWHEQQKFELQLDFKFSR